MKFALLSGSSRKKSESFKIASYIEAELKANSFATHMINLAGNPIPMWDESIWEGDAKWQTTWTPIATELQSADALVLVVPEWHGAVPVAVRNFLQLSSAQELGHKPALIVTVSSAVNGVYPVCELRMSAYKNNRILFIPENLIVRNAGKVLNGPTIEGDEDAYIRSRCTYALSILAEYAKALSAVRSSGVIDHKTFPNGM